MSEEANRFAREAFVTVGMLIAAGDLAPDQSWAAALSRRLAKTFAGYERAGRLAGLSEGRALALGLKANGRTLASEIAAEFDAAIAAASGEIQGEGQGQ